MVPFTRKLIIFDNYRMAVDVSAADQLTEQFRFQRFIIMLNPTQNNRVIVCSPANDTG